MEKSIKTRRVFGMSNWIDCDFFSTETGKLGVEV